VILRPKSPNQSYRFQGPNQETDHQFEAKLGETIATCFEAKPAKTIAAGFEAKLLETVTTGFEAKPVKTIRVVLRPNHSQSVAINFEAETDEKPSPLVLRPKQQKSSQQVLRPNR
jgi:hypothetical protein